jgi:hypothetical protein
MRRFVRLVDQVKQARNGATAPVSFTDVEKAWGRLYPLPKPETK